MLMLLIKRINVMKKFLILFTIALSLVIINHSCKPKEEEEPGSIYGVVTDKATGEPVKNANVQLRPTGETTLTGNDGRYEFLDVKNGEYSISVSKTGYTNLVDDYVIIVDGPKEMRRDVQIEKLPAALRVVDDSGNDINELDFGSSNDDLSRMFSIFNDGVNTLNYSIVKTAAWITSVSSESGTLQAGATIPIVVVIDRDKMPVGENKTTLHITSNDGSKQMTIKAEKISDVSTLDATNVTHDKAILKACINRDVVYSERGFYYGSDINNLSKIVVDGGGMGNYTYQLKNLEENRKYYYKAYMVKDTETVYGEVKEFSTLEDPYYGHEYIDLGLPSGLKWATYNVGASSKEDYGDYFAWGETETKSTYIEENSITYDVEMSDISGNSQYDVARKKWGSTWRMPTEQEMNELVDNCEWKWTQVNGVYGVEVTGPNDNCIFLPAAGNRDGSSLYYDGEEGVYWTSTPPVYDNTDYDNSIAFNLIFDNEGYGFVTVNNFSCTRYFGQPVRPVSE